VKELQQAGFHVRKGKITLVPGNNVYEKLKQTNPKKLARLMKQEMEFYLETNAPGYEERVQQEMAEYRAELEQRAKKSADYQLLTLDQVEGHITKRDVKNAYRRQSRRLHPDKGGSEEAFKELYAAYRRVLASVPKE
jgi:DnaJ domain